MYVRSTQPLARKKIVNRLIAGTSRYRLPQKKVFDSAVADRFELQTVSYPSRDRYRNLCNSEQASRVKPFRNKMQYRSRIFAEAAGRRKGNRHRVSHHGIQRRFRAGERNFAWVALDIQTRPAAPQCPSAIP